MKTFLTALLITFLCACSSLKSSDQVGLVGVIHFDGSGDVRTDGNITIAIGKAVGEAGAFGKLTQIPFVAPFLVDEGEVYVVNRRLDYEQSIPVGQPLPVWCVPLFRPGEAATLGIQFEGEQE